MPRRARHIAHAVVWPGPTAFWPTRTGHNSAEYWIPPTGGRVFHIQIFCNNYRFESSSSHPALTPHRSCLYLNLVSAPVALAGKLVKLKRPIAVMRRIASDQGEEGGGEGAAAAENVSAEVKDTRFEVVGVVRSKYHFKSRPLALISDPASTGVARAKRQRQAVPNFFQPHAARQPQLHDRAQP